MKLSLPLQKELFKICEAKKLAFFSMKEVEEDYVSPPDETVLFTKSPKGNLRYFSFTSIH